MLEFLDEILWQSIHQTVAVVNLACNKCMYNRARGFLAQEFSDAPDVVEMIVGVLAVFCDLHFYFQVGVKNHTRFRTDVTGVIWSSPTWMNGIFTHSSCCSLPTIKNSVLLSFTISMLEIIQLLNFATQFSMAATEAVWLMITGLALGFWEVLFYDLEKVGNIDDEQHRVKAWSLWYSSGQVFPFWKSSFNLYLLISLRKIWCEPFQSCSTNTKTWT